MSVPSFVLRYIDTLFPHTTMIDRTAPLKDWTNDCFVHSPPHQSRTFLMHAIKHRTLGKSVVLLMKTSILGTNYFPLVGPCSLVFFNHRLLFPGFFRRAPFSSMLVILRPECDSFSWKVLCSEISYTPLRSANRRQKFVQAI